MSARRYLALLAAAFTLPGPALAQPPTYFPGAPDLPFSEAVQAGDMLYLAGMLGTGPDGKLVPGGIEAESRQVMEVIGAALAKRGLTHADLVQCTVMLSDMAEWGRFNAVYKTYFKAGRYPARAAFGASGLALGARVELQCNAWNPQRGKRR